MLRSLASDKIILNSLLHFAEKEEKSNNEKSGSDSDEVMRKIIKYLLTFIRLWIYSNMLKILWLPR